LPEKGTDAKGIIPAPSNQKEGAGIKERRKHPEAKEKEGSKPKKKKRRNPFLPDRAMGS